MPKIPKDSIDEFRRVLTKILNEAGRLTTSRLPDFLLIELGDRYANSLKTNWMAKNGLYDNDIPF